MNLNNLIKEAYEIAKKKGWHDKLISFPNYIANIHAEISEAWEEWRNNRGLNEVYYECDKSEEQRCNIDLECQYCNFAKPRGIPIELADVVIRICDMFGELKINGEKVFSLCRTPGEFEEFIAKCHCYVSASFDSSDITALFGVISLIKDFCKENGIDLEQAIELKMAYNKTRPYRHNGKRV